MKKYLFLATLLIAAQSSFSQSQINEHDRNLAEREQWIVHSKNLDELLERYKKVDKSGKSSPADLIVQARTDWREIMSQRLERQVAEIPEIRAPDFAFEVNGSNVRLYGIFHGISGEKSAKSQKYLEKTYEDAGRWSDVVLLEENLWKLFPRHYSSVVEMHDHILADNDMFYYQLVNLVNSAPFLLSYLGAVYFGRENYISKILDKLDFHPNGEDVLNYIGGTLPSRFEGEIFLKRTFANREDEASVRRSLYMAGFLYGSTTQHRTQSHLSLYCGLAHAPEISTFLTKDIELAREREEFKLGEAHSRLDPNQLSNVKFVSVLTEQILFLWGGVVAGVTTMALITATIPSPDMILFILGSHFVVRSGLLNSISPSQFMFVGMKVN